MESSEEIIMEPINLPNSVNTINNQLDNTFDSTIDTLENNILNELNNFESTHPNIVSLWKEYIKIKRINFMKAIIDCESMIEKLSENRDVSQDTILLLYALFA